MSNPIPEIKLGAAERLHCLPSELTRVVWTEAFGSTAGPFHGIGGQMITPCEIEAWVSGVDSRAALFCGGRFVRTVNEFR